VAGGQRPPRRACNITPGVTRRRPTAGQISRRRVWPGRTVGRVSRRRNPTSGGPGRTVGRLAAGVTRHRAWPGCVDKPPSSRIPGGPANVARGGAAGPLPAKRPSCGAVLARVADRFLLHFSRVDSD
jgi:hypothetical protein